MSPRDGFQLAVGESSGLRGSLWDIWFGDRDIYLASAQFFGEWKASIHFDRPNKPGRVRYTGITTQVAHARGQNSSRAARQDCEWPGIELSPGSDYFLEFRLRVPRSELRPWGTSDLRPLNPDEPLAVHWLAAPPIGFATEVSIISAPPTHSGSTPTREDGAPSVPFIKRHLSNGLFVWFIQHVIPAPTSEAFRAYRHHLMTNRPVIDRRKSRSGPARAIVSMDCGDGSGAFAELVVNFPNSQRRLS